jgi:uncharacterized membrane protein YoaK (UPF0700 family)
VPNARPDHFALFTLGGALLALSAGSVNAVTLLAPGHLTATHVTGTTTRVALAAFEPDPTLNLSLALGAMLAFVLGAAISGAVLDSTRLALGRRYGLLLALEGGLFVAAAHLFAGGDAVGLLPAALASGLQNAIATQYSGAVVRTTHVTGIATDLGIALGKAIGRRGVDTWRVVLYLALFGGFGAGAVLGGGAFRVWGTDALYLPAASVGVVGAGYWLGRQLRAGRRGS